MELDEPTVELNLPPDRRPIIPEPLPVRLVAVGDVRADAIAGLEKAMDTFYVDLLQFAAGGAVASDDPHLVELVYHADNASLRFTVREPLFARDSLRPIAVEVLSLAALAIQLTEVQIEHTRQRGLSPGTETLVLQDPSGNWLEIVEQKRLL